MLFLLILLTLQFCLFVISSKYLQCDGCNYLANNLYMTRYKLHTSTTIFDRTGKYLDIGTFLCVWHSLASLVVNYREISVEINDVTNYWNYRATNLKSLRHPGTINVQ